MFPPLIRANLMPVLNLRRLSYESGKRLAEKVAIVTASTDGIGLAIARRLGQDGARVMVSSRQQKMVDAAVDKLSSEKLEVAGTVCHVAKADDRKRLLEKAISEFGGVDILVSNAGVNPVRPLLGPFLPNTTEEQWDKIFDVNLKAPFLLCKEVTPLIISRGGGSIVLVSSMGAYAPYLHLGPYCISKTGLGALAVVLAPELAASNIRINVLAPGLIRTQFSEMFPKTHEKEFLQKTAMKRIGKAEECAGTVSFLVSDDASYITGETILVAGGIAARL